MTGREKKQEKEREQEREGEKRERKWETKIARGRETRVIYVYTQAHSYSYTQIYIAFRKWIDYQAVKCTINHAVKCGTSFVLIKIKMRWNPR